MELGRGGGGCWRFTFAKKKKKNVVEKLEHCASSLPCTLAELGTLCLAAMKRPVAGSVQQAPSNSSQSAGALLFSRG